MNLKDMQLLIAMLRDVDNALAQLPINGKAPKHVHEVMTTSLERYRACLIKEFEQRHGISLEV